MSKEKIKAVVGDVIMDEFRETYDRESYLGVIVKADEDGGTTAAAIEKDSNGRYFNGLEQHRSLFFYTDIKGKMGDYGLGIA